jgi:hypothetical protein
VLGGYAKKRCEKRKEKRTGTMLLTYYVFWWEGRSVQKNIGPQETLFSLLLGIDIDFLVDYGSNICHMPPA